MKQNGKDQDGTFIRRGQLPTNLHKGTIEKNKREILQFISTKGSQKDVVI
jgi:hypothetical protein